MEKSTRRNHLIFLDGLRGLTALYVVIGHCRLLLWEGFSQGYALHPEQYNSVGKFLIYFLSLFEFGRRAVFLFFVLSGFVIHLRYAEMLKEKKDDAEFDLIPFLYRRFKRIYPPLLVVIALTVALDSIGIMNKYPIYAGATHYPQITMAVVTSYSPTSFVDNIFLIAGTPTWGTDGPLWSLRYEWAFYILYPFFWWLSRRSLKWSTGAMLILYALTFTNSLSSIPLFGVIFTYMPMWWCGVLLAEVYTGRLKFSLRKLSVLTLLLVPLLLLNYPENLVSVFWGLGFTGLMSFGLDWKIRGHSLKALEIFKPLGDMSYSLYLLHFPLLVLLSGWLMSRSPTGSLPSSFEWVPVGIIAALLIGNIGYFIGERPFMRSRPTLQLMSTDNLQA